MAPLSGPVRGGVARAGVRGPVRGKHEEKLVSSVVMMKTMFHSFNPSTILRMKMNIISSKI